MVRCGYLTVSNKPGRLEKISEMLRAIVRGGDVTKAHVASLHGLINFAGGYILGYELKPTARLLSKALSGPFLGNTPALREACALALDVISLSKPRVCHAAVLPPVVIYTDGAFEDDVGTWGVLVVDSHSGSRWLFGGRVPQCLIQHWHASAGDQVICEVEAYALVMTLFGLRGFLERRSVLAFIDNDPCRQGFVKRYSPSMPMMSLIALSSLLEGALNTSLWYERVPSQSSPSDLPSRAKRFAAAVKGDIACADVMSDFLKAGSYSPSLANALTSALRLEASLMPES